MKIKVMKDEVYFTRVSAKKSEVYPACPAKRLPNEISVALISSGRSMFIRSETCPLFV
jgi:hypothetical protein